VANISTHKPTRVDQAQGRLTRAVSRLEAAFDKIPAKKAESEPNLEVETLKTVNAKLRGDNTNLKAVNDQVSDGLDGAIGRLKAILES